MFLDHLFQGGIFFMLPIYVLWAIAFFLILKITFSLIRGKRNYSSIANQTKYVIFIGSIGLLTGLIGQIVALLEAFEVLEKMEEVPIQFLLDGLWISFIAPIYGCSLFLVTLIFSLFTKVPQKRLELFN